MKQHPSILTTFIFIISLSLSMQCIIYAQIYTWEKVCTVPNARTTCLYVNEKEDIFYGCGGGVFRSTDAGVSWKQVSNIWDITVLTNHQGDLYTGGDVISRSSDNGDTWINLGLVPGFVYSLGFNSKGYIYSGGTGSVSRTTNNGLTWTTARFIALDVNFIHVNPKDNIIIGADGGYFGGIFRSFDDGLTWNNTDIRYIPTCICRDADGKLYVGTLNAGVYFSSDEGLHWDPKTGLEKNWIRSILIDSTGIIVVGTDDGIFQSSDKGKTWIQCFNTKVSQMCLSATGSIYVLAGDTNIYRTEQSIMPPLQPTLAVPPDQDKCKPNELTLQWNISQNAKQYHLQIATDPQFIQGIFLNDSTINDISRTVTGLSDTSKYYWRVRAWNIAGFSPWANIRSFGTAGGSIQSPLLSSPSNNKSVPWRKINLQWNFNPCANSYNVQLSIDSGFTAIALIDSSLTNTNLFINQLQAGVTYYWRVRAGRGTIFSNWSSVSRFITDAPTSEPPFMSNNHNFSLSQNSPNPFSNSTSISYQLSTPTHVRLEVFDLLGRKVATFVDEEKDAGEYAALFDIRNSLIDIHCGVYLYRLSVGKNVLTKKMIVLK